jgi:hypothetical protein
VRGVEGSGAEKEGSIVMLLKGKTSCNNSKMEFLPLDKKENH